MRASDSRDEVFRTLTFGIKKTKQFDNDTLSNGRDNNKLRMRVLVDDVTPRSDRNQQQTLKDEVPPNTDADATEEPELLGGSGLSLKMRKKKVEERERCILKEKMNRLRKLNRIYTWGDDVPDVLIDLSDIKAVPQQLLSSLAEQGIDEPTPIQMQAIPLMLQRRELLASAPTGSGKTLAFAIPIVLEVLRLKRLAKYREGNKLLALVLEPTRELAKQTYVQLIKLTQNLDVNCALMHEDSPPEHVDVLVSTPNRMAYSIESNLPKQYFKWLRWLVVDESDRLFDTTEGESRCFRDQLSKVYQACNGNHTHRALFSATFSYQVEQWCKLNLHNLAVVCIGARNSAVHSVSQELVFAGSEHGKIVALRAFFQQGFSPPALIFVQSKDRARQLLSQIETFHPPIPTAIISSEKSPKERDEAIAKFREGSVWVLVCTELAGRGLDLKGVNVVINFDMPTSLVSYIHRIGRTGRAGRSGRALTYFTENDLDSVRPIATAIHQAGFPVPEYTLKMRKLTRNRRKDLLKRPPHRKNIGSVKKRSVKQSTVQHDSSTTSQPSVAKKRKITAK